MTKSILRSILRCLLLTLLFYTIPVQGLAAQEAAGSEETGISEATETERKELAAALRDTTSLTAAQLNATFGTVPRHRFISGPSQAMAYLDTPVPLGKGALLPAPSELAAMIAPAGDLSGKKVLVAGPDSGYLAALVSRLAEEVTQIEFTTDNASTYASLYQDLGYDNITIESGKGRLTENSTQRYDALLLAYSTDTVELSLFSRLNSTAGILVSVLSYKGGEQLLTEYRRVRNGVSVKVLDQVFFP